ncbi:recombinase family protein [Pseudomonas aeruginosa]|uniref:recombinase family protein n=1 Tax=Pseudomonas aeruginosa TaxID=287 RepID=UPI001F4CD033|nr:recombinase family protein [Pseudomonas aeruginosa]MCO2549229.1 recombinase family protein [Pseudomonas aeruginosa]UTN34316.1 recombinase family protein [Pseudomonas aeruginosa]WCY35002.1 recombinase family protein [Pseudomonas aeruginosa]WCY40913.1 recombinase family protein [Pseudomonas aeruginosa]
MKPKAYSYIRFSSPEQSRGDSQRRQREAAAKYAEEHNLELVLDKDYQFFDAGISAYKGRNSTHEGKLRRFYDYVKDGRIKNGSYLLVESLDRLSREDVLIALPRFIDLLNEGVNVVTLADGIVYSKGADVPQLIMSIVHMSRAHHESKLKGERVSKAWRNKQKVARQDHIPLGRVCPYWIDLVDGQYILNDAKAAVVKKIFEMTIGGHGQVSVAKYLNSSKIPVFGSGNRNKSGLWGTSTIAKILSNRSVLGEYQPMILENGKRIKNGMPIEGYYPPVVSESDFYSAAYMRSVRRTSNDTRQSIDFNVWSKIIFCSKCGSPMHLINKGRPPKGYRYLRCFSAAKGMCAAKSIRLEAANIAFKEILAMFNSLPLVKVSEKDSRRRITELKGKVEEIHKLLGQYQCLMESAPSITLSKAAAAKEVELIACENELAQVSEELAASVIFDKDKFFASLDLESYEGRSSANLYLRNLNVQIRAGYNGFESFFVAMTRDEGLKAHFAIWVGDDFSPKFTPLSVEMTETIINQGEVGRARMVAPLKRYLPDLIDRTEGNGRLPSVVPLNEVPEFEWHQNPEHHKNRLLRALGLLPEE